METENIRRTASAMMRAAKVTPPICLKGSESTIFGAMALEAGRRVYVPLWVRDALSACAFVWYYKIQK